MATQNLLAHLTHRHVTQRENLATDALCYLLTKSTVASGALLGLLTGIGVRLSGSHHFRTQAWGEDGAIPDLVGRDAAGNDSLIIEAKFWAGLTPNQPVTYLKRLSSLNQGALVFVVPAKRLELIWHELLQRCDSIPDGLKRQSHQLDEVRIVELGATHLVVLSWRIILRHIGLAMEDAGERALVADLEQLQGLCEFEDSEAFLPLTSEELTSDIGRRIIQFGELIDDVIEKLAAEGIADTKYQKHWGGNGCYGRYFYMEGAGCCFCFQAGEWATTLHSPLWLHVTGQGFKSTPWVDDCIERWSEATGVPIIAWTPNYGGYELPVRLPTGVDRAAVFVELERQILRIRDALAIARKSQPATPTLPTNDSASVR